MKTRSLKRARVSRIARQGFEPRLSAYSTTSLAVLAATTAAGLSGTASAQTIQTITTFNIDHSGTFVTTPPSATAPNGASIQRVFTAATAAHETGFKGAFQPFSTHGSAVVHMWNQHGSQGNLTAQKFAFGAAISHATGVLSADKNFLLAIGPAVRSHPGNFLPNGAGATVTGYVGFKTHLRGQTYYGWLRVKVTNNGSDAPTSATLVDTNTPGVFGAFALAGDDITAGEVSAIPEPANVAGGLALLALGAAGVREMRRRRQTA